MTFPSTGTLATLAGTEVLTNKDIDGGTATNALRITVPKNTKTNLDALTRKVGTIVYGTDTLVPYVDNGTTLAPIPSFLYTPVTSYTPSSIANLGTTSSVVFWYERMGDYIYIEGSFSSGTAAAAAASISLPAGFTASASYPSGINVVGPLARNVVGADQFAVCVSPGATSMQVVYQNAGASLLGSGPANGTTIGSSAIIRLSAKIRIT